MQKHDAWVGESYELNKMRKTGKEAFTTTKIIFFDAKSMTVFKNYFKIKFNDNFVNNKRYTRTIYKNHLKIECLKPVYLEPSLNIGVQIRFC